jgi:reactive intermediate/imine deaminase
MHELLQLPETRAMPSPLFHMITGAPDPVAPFSHAVEADGWVFVTGQMPFTGTTLDSPYPQGIEAQSHQVLKNLDTVLVGCGLGLAHALSVRIYLTHFDQDYDAMNTVYASYFPVGRRPARTCIGVTGLAKGARIEIDLVARRGAVSMRPSDPV